MILDRLRREVAKLSLDTLDLMLQVTDILRNIGRNIINDSIYVSDLTRCILKVAFTRRLIRKCKNIDELIKTLFKDKGIDSIMMGFLVQYGLERFMESIGLRKSSITWRKVITIDDVKIVLSGKPDYEAVIDGKIVPVEVKFTRKSIDRPYPSYVTQCSTYAWLCNAPYCKLLIFTPDGAHEHDIEPITEETLRLIVKKWLTTAPLWKWECRYCPYREECDEELRRRVREGDARKNIRIIQEIENM